jgi:hypothetical protein
MFTGVDAEKRDEENKKKKKKRRVRKKTRIAYSPVIGVSNILC